MATLRIFVVLVGYQSGVVVDEIGRERDIDSWNLLLVAFGAFYSVDNPPRVLCHSRRVKVIALAAKVFNMVDLVVILASISGLLTPLLARLFHQRVG